MAEGDFERLAGLVRDLEPPRGDHHRHDVHLSVRIAAKNGVVQMSIGAGEDGFLRDVPTHVDDEHTHRSLDELAGELMNDLVKVGLNTIEVIERGS
jgi:hypothetical protein